MAERLVLTPTYDSGLTLSGDNGRLVVRESQELPLEMQSALRGPAGADGPGASGTVRRPAVAGASLAAYRAVYIAAGVANYASSSNYATAVTCLGITAVAAETGEEVIVVTFGKVSEASWSWSPGAVYLGVAGVLTQTAPSVGAVIEIGIATSAIEIDIRVRLPIDEFSNLDGGTPSSVYGGISNIDGGGP